MKKPRYFLVTYSSANNTWILSKMSHDVAISKEGRTWAFRSLDLAFKIGIFYEASDGVYAIFDAKKSAHMSLFIKQALYLELDRANREETQFQIIEKVCALARKVFSFR